MQPVFEHFEADPILLGYGNENGVRELINIEGKPVDDGTGTRKVIKTGNSAFFGWQSPEYREISRYLRVLAEHGIELRESVELHQDPIIEKVINCTKLDLLKTFFTKTLTVGFVLKMLTKQWGRKCNYAIVEDFSEDGCLTLEDITKDPEIRRQVRELLESSEKILEEEDLFVDPLGGAAISAALKYLVDPTNEPIISNLAIENGHVVLTDFGLMNVKNTERIYEIPHTEWAMKIALSFLGHLAFEALNITLRDRGEDIEPRPLTIENAIPKAAAGVGCRTVFLAQRIYKTLDWTWLTVIGESCRSIS